MSKSIMIEHRGDLRELPIETISGVVSAYIDAWDVSRDCLEWVTSFDLNGGCDWEETDIAVPSCVMEVFETVTSVRVKLSYFRVEGKEFVIGSSLEAHRVHLKGKIGAIIAIISHSALNYCRKNDLEHVDIRIEIDGVHDQLGWSGVLE